MPKPLKKSESDINALLLIGLYQILFLRISDHAAVNESVNAAKDLNKAWASKLINAVLRNFLRQRESIMQQVTKDMAAEYAHPAWLIKIIKACWPEQWSTILTANNEHPPLWLRVNLHKTNREEYLKQLASHEIEAVPSNVTASGIRLLKPLPVNEIPGFAEGLVSVQDDAAQLAAYLLDLLPEQNVLDACAAPGGKAMHILELQPKLANLTAIDNDAERVERIKENLTRLKLKANLITGDAALPATWWNKQSYDRILLDAPCSATGVIRRHPDIKLLRQAQDITKLAEQQYALLSALWPLLKPAGILLYVTCSILKEENENVIEKFLHGHSDAESILIDVPNFHASSNGLQILPGMKEMDGFYYAKLMKKA